MASLTLGDLTINPEGLDRETLLAGWAWAMEQPMLPVLLTAMGDVFAQGESGAVYFIDATAGTITKIAEDGATFQQLLGDVEFVTGTMHPSRIVELRDAGVPLGQHEVYSHKHPMVLGGSDELDNYETCHVTVHVGMLGQIHEQVKDLPPGTPISDISFE